MTAARARPFQPRLADLLAALSVTGLLIPEAVAYAQLAGMPARAGLLALLCGLVAYGLVGRNRFAIASATSSGALILASGLAALGAENEASRAAYAACVVGAAGAWFVLASVFRLGFLAQYVARPVLRGVTLGLAISITVSQLPVWFGLHASGNTWQKISFLLRHLGQIHPASFAVGLLGLLILFGWRSRRQPVALWLIALSIVCAKFFHLDTHGVKLVGDISLAAFRPDFQAVRSEVWLNIAQLGGLLALMLYAESYSSIRGFAVRYGEKTEPNRDLMALGLANLSSGLFGGLAVGAGFSATSANEQAGAQSRAAGWFAAGLVVLTIALALPQLAWIPDPILAAIVIHAVSHGLSWKPLGTYFRWNRDRRVVMSAVLAVLVFGVLNGLLIAVVISVLLTLARFSQPKICELGRWNGSHNFVNLARFPSAIRLPGLLVLRVDGPLFFANVDSILDQLRERLHGSRNEPVHSVILSMEESPDLDGTCVEALGTLANELAGQGRQLRLCRLHSSALQVLREANFSALTPAQLSSLSVDDAVRAALPDLWQEGEKKDVGSGL